MYLHQIQTFLDDIISKYQENCLGEMIKKRKISAYDVSYFGVLLKISQKPQIVNRVSCFF